MSAEKAYKGFSNLVGEFFQTCLSLLKVLLRSASERKLPRAEEKTCIVLGNGPSLHHSLEGFPGLFQQHPLICVNHFSSTDHYARLKPAYYVLLDPSFWFGEDERIHSTLHAIRDNTSWKMHLLVPPLAKKSKLFNELLKKNPHIIPCYFNYTVYKGFENIGFMLYEKNLAMPQSQNVLVASLFLAINMGFQRVLLFGADHDWHHNLFVDANNTVCVRNAHFYENREKVSYRPFYKGVHLQETFKMHEVMEVLGKAFYGYIAINNYAVHKGAEIYNMNESSFVDAFKRMKPEHAVHL